LARKQVRKPLVCGKVVELFNDIDVDLYMQVLAHMGGQLTQRYNFILSSAFSSIFNLCKDVNTLPDTFRDFLSGEYVPADYPKSDPLTEFPQTMHLNGEKHLTIRMPYCRNLAAPLSAIACSQIADTEVRTQFLDIWPSANIEDNAIGTVLFSGTLNSSINQSISTEAD
jgi:hypothetical protein